MCRNKPHKSRAEPSPLPLFDWSMLHTQRVRTSVIAADREVCDTRDTRARTMDREADVALFYGRAKAAERLSNRAAELREAAR